MESMFPAEVQRSKLLTGNHEQDITGPNPQTSQCMSLKTSVY